jgi:hypothetical protein
VIDDDIVEELEAQAIETLKSFKKSSPNLAKTAGSIAFWIRKLKPISHAETSPNKYLAINELAGLHVGVAICSLFYDDSTRTDFHKLSPRVVHDWAYSLRRHSHSPQSTVVAFELISAQLNETAKVAAA